MSGCYLRFVSGIATNSGRKRRKAKKKEEEKGREFIGEKSTAEEVTGELLMDQEGDPLADNGNQVDALNVKVEHEHV